MFVLSRGNYGKKNELRQKCGQKESWTCTKEGEGVDLTKVGPVKDKRAVLKQSSIKKAIRKR